MKVWISKYALTRGIYEEDNTSEAAIACRNARPTTYYRGWHSTHKEAIAQAELMRKKKILSLTKQLARLERMRFDVPSVE